MHNGFFTFVSNMIMLVFVLVFVLVIGGFIFSAYLGYKCYASGNPNDISCFMISDRHEIGIRNR